MRMQTTWLLVAFLLGGLSVSAQWKKVEGEGSLIKQNRNLTGFQSVSLAGGMQVLVSTSATTSVTVEAEGNLQEYILTEVNGNTLKIKMKDGYSVKSKGIVVHVAMPAIGEAAISGSGTIRSEQAMSSNGEFRATISGSGNIDMKVNSTETEARISGSGNISLAGSTGDLEVVISGSGSFHGYSLAAKEAEVKISGSGNIETTVNGELDAVISGSGSIFYKGNADISLKSSGSGRVKKMD